MNKSSKIVLAVLMIALIFPLIIYAIVGLIFTIRAEMDPNQTRFKAGKFPDPLPDGLYRGNADGQGTWIGKEFNRNEQTGINNFQNGESIDKNFPFITY